MSILVRCETCSRSLRAQDASRGRRVRCPGCGALLVVEGERLPDHDVFLSYSKHDKQVADAVCAALENGGIRCWIAPRDIVAGRDWGEAIIGGIEDCRVMVVVLSRESNGSVQVQREIERAVAKKVVVIPFRIEDVPLTRNLEYFLSLNHWLDAFTEPLEGHVERLRAMVEALLAEMDPPGARRAKARPEAEVEPAPRSRRRPVLLAAGGVAAVLVALAYAALRPTEEKTTHGGLGHLDGGGQQGGTEPAPEPVDDEPRVDAAALVGAVEGALAAAELGRAEGAFEELRRELPDAPQLGELGARLSALRSQHERAGAAAAELDALRVGPSLEQRVEALEAQYPAAVRAATPLGASIRDARQRMAERQSLEERLAGLERRAAGAGDVAEIERELAALAPELPPAMQERVAALRAQLDATVAGGLRGASEAPEALRALRRAGSFALLTKDTARVRGLVEAGEPATRLVERKIAEARRVEELAPIAAELSIAPPAPVEDAVAGLRALLVERVGELAGSARDPESALAVMRDHDRCIARTEAGALRDALRGQGALAIDSLRDQLRDQGSVLEAGSLVAALSRESPEAYAADLEELRELLLERAQGEADELGSDKQRGNYARDLAELAEEHATGSMRARIEACSGEILAGIQAAWREEIEGALELALAHSYDDAIRSIDDVVAAASKGSATWMSALRARAEILQRRGNKLSGNNSGRRKSDYIAAVDVYEELLRDLDEYRDQERKAIAKQATEECIKTCRSLETYFDEQFKAKPSKGSRDSARKYADLRKRLERSLQSDFD